MIRKRLEDRRRREADRLPDPMETIRGTVVKRYLPCGTPGCRCHRGKGHGPYYYLMTAMPPRKTLMVLLVPEQVKMVTGWVKNFKAFRTRLEKITEINVELLREDRKAARRSARSRGRKG